MKRRSQPPRTLQCLERGGGRGAWRSPRLGVYSGKALGSASSGESGRLWGKAKESLPVEGSAENPQTLQGPTPSRISTPSAKRSLLKLQGFPWDLRVGASLPAWGYSQTAALPNKERNPSPNNGLETYRERQKKSELESRPCLGPPRPALLLPPSTLSRPPPLASPAAFLPPSLSPLALSPLLPFNPELSLSLSLLSSLFLSPSASCLSSPHCLLLLLSLSSHPPGFSLRSSQYILTLLYPPAPRPAQLRSAAGGRA